MADAELRRRVLLEMARLDDAVEGKADEFGRRFIIRSVVTNRGKSAPLRSAWIVRTGESNPHFVTRFVELN